VNKINFIQDEATPHNNLLIGAIDKHHPGVLNLWYARDNSEIYAWKESITHEIIRANIFGITNICWKLLGKIFTNEKIFLVGWVNPTARLMIILMFFLRRRYSMWFDLPNDSIQRTKLSSFLRELFYTILLYSRSKVFCVGEETVKYFMRRGFAKDRLVNLPVFVEMTKNYGDRGKFERKYTFSRDKLFITSGSRLVKDKGYDLLLESLALCREKENIKLIVVGNGPELEKLKEIISNRRMKDFVSIEPWMDIEDMRELIASSDLFIHPARWDAFGAGTLNAMALKVPVISSNKSGSGPDRIRHGVNGWIYEAEDVKALASQIDYCYLHREDLKNIGENAYQSSLDWPLDRGVDIFMGNLI
jgi:glycosyltransferase involved in cell wall biosynthesis